MGKNFNREFWYAHKRVLVRAPTTYKEHVIVTNVLVPKPTTRQYTIKYNTRILINSNFKYIKIPNKNRSVGIRCYFLRDNLGSIPSKVGMGQGLLCGQEKIFK